MNVLSITSDINVLREKSAAREELIKRSQLAHHLVVIVLNTELNRYPIDKVSDTLLILPTNSFARFLTPFRALRQARRELYLQGRLQADIVEGDDPSWAGFVAWLIANRYRAPYQLSMDRNVLSASYGRQSLLHTLQRALAHFLVRRAHAITIASENIRASLAEISAVVADRAIMEPHFMDIDAFQKEPVRVDLAAKYPQFKFIMLMATPLEKWANVQLAIAALAGITRLYPSVGLIIVGDGSQRHALQSQARRAGVSDNVVFENWNDDIFSYFKSARVFLMTAPFEEYADSLAIAAAAGCAIVTTPVGIATSIIEDGVSGFICEANDSERFAASVILMLRKPELCVQVRMSVSLAIQKFMSSDEAAYLEFVKRAWEQAVATAAKEKQSFS